MRAARMYTRAGVHGKGYERGTRSKQRTRIADTRSSVSKREPLTPPSPPFMGPAEDWAGRGRASQTRERECEGSD